MISSKFYIWAQRLDPWVEARSASLEWCVPHTAGMVFEEMNRVAVPNIGVGLEVDLETSLAVAYLWGVGDEWF